MKRRFNSISDKIWLLIDLGLHMILSLGFAYIFYKQTGLISWAILCIIGGVFIDIDHFMDYYKTFGIRFILNRFLYELGVNARKFYVIFHSWELIFILWLISGKVQWCVPLATGMTLHLIVDQIIHHLSEPLFYFVLYRWFHGFEKKRLEPGH